MIRLRPHLVEVIAVASVILVCGILVLRFTTDRGGDVPRLIVWGRSHGEGQHVVAFRVLLPESRRSVGCVFSKPQVIDAAGRITDVALIRYTTPAKEPTLGFVEDASDSREYLLRLGVALEEKGVVGWIHRVRNCWVQKTLKPLREVTYGDYLPVTGEWITNAIVQTADTSN